MVAVQNPAMVAANAQARVQGQTQARLLASPLQKRSALLAQMLEQQQNPQQIGGYGDLGVRLLAQGLTQYASDKTDKDLAATQSNADLARRKALAASLGISVTGDPVEAGNGRLGNPLSGLARMLRREPPQPAQPEAVPAPATPAMPTVTNTQTPVESNTAPVAPVTGQPLAPAGPQVSPQPAPQAPAAAPAPAPAMPQPPTNPLGPTAEERALLGQWLNSGDPGQVAQAEQLIQQIQVRQSAPAAARQKTETMNGVLYLVDPTGATPPVPAFPNGIPQEARTQDVMNVPGLTPGTFGQRDPNGTLHVINEPSTGYMRPSGEMREVPIPGGPNDPAAGGNMITNERNLRREYQDLTQAYRDARSGFEKVQAAARDDTGASDIALIFGFMKTLDPGSTVREGEFATAQQSGGIPDRIVAAYNNALNGQRLSPEQRRAFVDTATTQFQTYQRNYEDRTADYIGMAEQYGLTPQNIVGRQREGIEGPSRPTPRRASPAPASAPRAAGTRRRYNPNTGQIE